VAKNIFPNGGSKIVLGVLITALLGLIGIIYADIKNELEEKSDKNVCQLRYEYIVEKLDDIDTKLDRLIKEQCNG